MSNTILRGDDLDAWLSAIVDEVPELHLGQVHRLTVALCLKRPPQVRQRTRSALFHLRRACMLASVDPEMAAFRSITAVEESVTAIFHSLRRLGYEGATDLGLYSHVHKSAVDPFLRAVQNCFATSISGVSLTLEFSGDTLRLRFPLTREDTGEVVWAYPEPPLNFTVDVNGQPYAFSMELRQIESAANVKSIVDHVRAIANKRNGILYASDRGVPQWDGDVLLFIQPHALQVFRNLTILLLIDQAPAPQPFVQQSVFAFLRMLGKVKPRVSGD